MGLMSSDIPGYPENGFKSKTWCYPFNEKSDDENKASAYKNGLEQH